MEAGEKLYLTKLFRKFKEKKFLENEIRAFERYLKDFSIEMLSRIPDSQDAFKKTETGKYLQKKLSVNADLKAAADTIIASLQKCGRQKTFEQFSYARKHRGLSCPIIIDGKVQGFVVLLGLKRPVPASLQTILRSFIDSVIRETQKELEIEELNLWALPWT
jgi:hypothetical protein